MSQLKPLTYAIVFLCATSLFSQIGIHGDVYLPQKGFAGFLASEIYFNNGVVQSPNGKATVYFAPELIWRNASDKSHMATYVETPNHENFIYPIGDSKVLHPLAIHDAQNARVKTAYFEQKIFANQLGEDLEQLAAFHWEVKGDAAVQVSLYWNAQSKISALTNDLATLVFAGYNGSQWVTIPAKLSAINLAEQGTASLIAGKIISNDPIDFSTYTYLTIARKVGNTNLFISEAFSPNGDGINDVWYLQNAVHYPQMEIHVYNRWGEEVFVTTNGYDNNWNGVFKQQSTPLPSSSYFYQIDLEADGKVDFQGWVFIQN